MGAAKVSAGERGALLALPVPGWVEDRVWMGVGRTRSYSETWRKVAEHWEALLRLEERGLVERKVSRGETLWRLTRPEGIFARASLSQPMEAERG